MHAHLHAGLATLGTADEEVFEDMKNILYADSAIAGEGAGIGLGLLLAGTGSAKAEELLAYAHETQHEKIIRGVSLGLALAQYGCEEGAEPLIEQMTHDQDPIIRYGGMYAIGLAYRWVTCCCIIIMCTSYDRSCLGCQCKGQPTSYGVDSILLVRYHLRGYKYSRCRVVLEA